MPFSLDPPPEENEIECAQCGAYFFYDLTRCPACGASVYAFEDETEEDIRQALDERRESQSGFWGWIKSLFRRFRKRPYSAEEIFGDPLDQAILYNNLLQKVGGDHTVVERLINFEQKQKPGGNRKTWLENAIDRWERDNRIKSAST
jgi:hypothetical protein